MPVPLSFWESYGKVRGTTVATERMKNASLMVKISPMGACSMDRCGANLCSSREVHLDERAGTKGPQP